jgi:hypothetical protein
VLSAPSFLKSCASSELLLPGILFLTFTIALKLAFIHIYPLAAPCHDFSISEEYP